MVSIINYIEKYRPKSKADFIGNKSVLDEVIKNISDGVHVLVSGSTGIGKTSMSQVVANELGMTLISVDQTWKKDGKTLTHLVEKMKTKSLFSKNLYVYENVDALNKKPPESTYVQKMLKQSSHPIFLTANDGYKVPYPIKKYCKKFKLKPPKLKLVADRIKRIAKQEGIPLSKVNFKRANTDIRSSIIACFDSSSSMRIADNNFKRTEKAFRGEISDVHPAWLMDNVHRFYHGLDVYEAIKILTFAIETNDNYFYSCLPKSRGGRATYPYYLRRK